MVKDKISMETFTRLFFVLNTDNFFNRRETISNTKKYQYQYQFQYPFL